MGVYLSDSFTKRYHAWQAWKSFQSKNAGIYQHIESDGQYTIWFYDGPEIHACTIWLGEVPTDVSERELLTQAQNDANKLDWETNYKLSSNWPLDKKEKDGRSVVRISTAVPGRRYRIHAFYFKTSDPVSLRNAHANTGVDMGDVQVKCYDAANALLSGDFTTAVKTIVAFESLVDIELIGGWLEVDPTLLGGTTDAWWVAAVAAPDVPSIYGGNIDYLNETNLEIINTGRITMDGRASAVVKYDAQYHSGKLIFIFKHPAGASKRFQMFLETFR